MTEAKQPKGGRPPKSEENPAQSFGQGSDPRRVCEGTILREERNLAQLRQYRLHLAVPYTMGDEHAIEQVGVTERSMERCSRRLGLARLALEALEREEATR